MFAVKNADGGTLGIDTTTSVSGSRSLELTIASSSNAEIDGPSLTASLTDPVKKLTVAFAYRRDDYGAEDGVWLSHIELVTNGIGWTVSTLHESALGSLISETQDGPTYKNDTVPAPALASTKGSWHRARIEITTTPAASAVLFVDDAEVATTKLGVVGIPSKVTVNVGNVFSFWPGPGQWRGHLDDVVVDVE